MSATGDKFRELASLTDLQAVADEAALRTLSEKFPLLSSALDALTARVAKLEAAPVVVPPVVTAPTLSTLSANQPATLTKPTGWVKDPTYGCMVRQGTSVPANSLFTFVRHQYSRHQAVSADGKTILAQSNKMSWHLFDAETGAYIKQVPLAIHEVQWHPTDPKVLYFVNGLSVYQANTDTFAALRVATIPAMSGSTLATTKGEGSMSADGRYWGFILANGTTACGLAVVDVIAGTVVSQLAASAWGGAMPDHCSISAKGERMVVAWHTALGTRSYTRDLKSSVQLHTTSTHSDMALGADGSDQYVYNDYTGPDAGWICTRNAAGGPAVRLVPLYPASGASYTAHISGKCFDMPGWVLVSTYNDSQKVDGVKVSPDPVNREYHRKLFLVELKAGGERKNVIHTRQLQFTEYWDEPHGTISRDGKLAVFASRWLNTDARSCSYVAKLP